MPMEVKHVFEAGGELGVSVADEEPESPPCVFEVGGEVAGDLGDPGTDGVGRDAEQVHPSPVELDHEEHVEASERDRVDGEEVGCHYDLGLGAEELDPGRTRAPGRRREYMAAQHGGHARLGDGNTELLQLPDVRR